MTSVRWTISQYSKVALANRFGHGPAKQVMPPVWSPVNWAITAGLAGQRPGWPAVAHEREPVGIHLVTYQRHRPRADGGVEQRGAGPKEDRVDLEDQFVDLVGQECGKASPAGQPEVLAWPGFQRPHLADDLRPEHLDRRIRWRGD